MSHVHEHLRPLKVTVFESGRRVEYCECGATRETDAQGNVQPWHTCDLCTHPWGMGQEGIEPSTRGS